MKQIFGVILILLAIPFGFYIGGWICFIGGITQVIEGVKISPVDSLAIAIGIAKIFGATLAGLFAFFVMLIPGVTMLKRGVSARHGFIRK